MPYRLLGPPVGFPTWFAPHVVDARAITPIFHWRGFCFGHGTHAQGPLPPMIDLSLEPDAINFGDLPAPIDTLLQLGVRAYRGDKVLADRYFRDALASDPSQLPVYFCLYKIHAYQGNFADARMIAEAGLREAARQAGWSGEWRQWVYETAEPEGPGRFALYTLKALAFIDLRRGTADAAREKLAALRVLDPTGAVGWPVVAALAEGIAG